MSIGMASVPMVGWYYRLHGVTGCSSVSSQKWIVRSCSRRTPKSSTREQGSKNVTSLTLLGLGEQRCEHLKNAFSDPAEELARADVYLVNDGIHDVLVQSSVLQNREDPARTSPRVRPSDHVSGQIYSGNNQPGSKRGQADPYLA